MVEFSKGTLKTKKQRKRTDIKGIINNPLLSNFVNKYPKKIEPIIAVISYIMGIEKANFVRLGLDWKYRGS